MRGLSNRVAALEVGGPSELSPAAKAWLGWQLTDAERAALDQPESRPGEYDTTKWSKEAKRWLGVD